MNNPDCNGLAYGVGIDTAFCHLKQNFDASNAVWGTKDHGPSYDFCYKTAPDAGDDCEGLKRNKCKGTDGCEWKKVEKKPKCYAKEKEEEPAAPLTRVPGNHFCSTLDWRR